MIVGESEVDGQPEELAAKLAGLLPRDAMGPLGAIKIMSCDRHEVVFMPSGQPSYGAGGFRQGRIKLTPLSSSKTRVAYALEASSGKVMPRLGWLSLLLGLVAITVSP